MESKTFAIIDWNVAIKLTRSEILLFSLIRGFQLQRKPFYMRNRVIAEKLQISDTQASLTIKKLVDRKLIKSKIIKGWRYLTVVEQSLESVRGNTPEPKPEVVKPKTKPKVNKYTERDYNLALDLLNNNILKLKPNRKFSKASGQRWAEAINKIHRLDGESYQHIGEIINWVNSDEFWNAQILSGNNLRKHFMKLSIRFKKSRLKHTDRAQKNKERRLRNGNRVHNGYQEAHSGPRRFSEMFKR